MKLMIGKVALFLQLTWWFGVNCSSAFGSQPEEGTIGPPGHFFLAEVTQANKSAYWICSQEGLRNSRGWVRRELHTLIPGSPRPSVVEIRRHVRATIEALGGRIDFEGRCVEMDSLGDPRANHVILTGLVPTPWGDLYLELWPWEEGEALHCQMTFVLEDPMPSP